MPRCPLPIRVLCLLGAIAQSVQAAVLIDSFDVGGFAPRLIPRSLFAQEGLPDDRVLGGARRLNADVGGSDYQGLVAIDEEAGTLVMEGGESIGQFRMLYGGGRNTVFGQGEPLGFDFDAVADRFVVRFASSGPVSEPMMGEPPGAPAALRVALRTARLGSTFPNDFTVTGIDVPLVESSEPYDLEIMFDDIRNGARVDGDRLDFSYVTYVYFSIVGYNPAFPASQTATEWGVAIESIQAVPEPSAVMLIALAAMGLPRSRH